MGNPPCLFEDALGLNWIQEMVKTMLADTFINAKKVTNYSLCATGATKLIDAGVLFKSTLATVQQKH